mmetsp:Transcript_73804/g.230210  ORF Transcript_73804/g.230210 Transcript_73804/m.230210 type:complete len:201 (-) Transcript_73804:100-702(-)
MKETSTRRPGSPSAWRTAPWRRTTPGSPAGARTAAAAARRAWPPRPRRRSGSPQSEADRLAGPPAAGAPPPGPGSPRRSSSSPAARAPRQVLGRRGRSCRRGGRGPADRTLALWATRSGRCPLGRSRGGRCLRPRSPQTVPASSRRTRCAWRGSRADWRSQAGPGSLCCLHCSAPAVANLALLAQRRVCQGKGCSCPGRG